MRKFVCTKKSNKISEPENLHAKGDFEMSNDDYFTDGSEILYIEYIEIVASTKRITSLCLQTNKMKRKTR